MIETMTRPVETFLETLLAADVPQQFAPDVLLEIIGGECARLGLPAPGVQAGNIVVGDLTSASVVLSAHLDEASFSVTGVDDSRITLSACHRFNAQADPIAVSFSGIRDGHVRGLGHGELILGAHGLECGPDADIRLGDRAVYRHHFERSAGHFLTATAIDDRVGAAVALHTAADLNQNGVATAVVLSDGEQNHPDGYFSRTFPHVLPVLLPEALIVFIDGIFQDGLHREHLTGPPAQALIVPHSGDGTGYSVPPKLFAQLRDDIIPAARTAGIDVRTSSAYHSRGDDWGMVTNPTTGTDQPGFFVSFGGWGDTPARRTIDTRSLIQCIAFTSFSVRQIKTARLQPTNK